MILIIRGHIRDSFNDDKLYNLIKKIYQENNNLNIFISTFNIIQNNISWRQMDTINIVVNEDTIYNYFKDLSHLIKKILIIDDTKIKLIGNISGNVNNSPAPLIGWKNYWYCKYQIINYINNLFEDKNKFVVNLRFDIFSNSNNFTETEIINLIEPNKNFVFVKNIFIKSYNCYGIDNIYIGDIESQYKIISHFFNNLDDILVNNTNINNQEFLVFIENEKILLF